MTLSDSVEITRYARTGSRLPIKDIRQEMNEVKLSGHIYLHYVTICHSTQKIDNMLMRLGVLFYYWFYFSILRQFLLYTKNNKQITTLIQYRTNECVGSKSIYLTFRFVHWDAWTFVMSVTKQQQQQQRTQSN